MNQAIWKMLTALAGFVAAWASRQAATALWTQFSDTDGPMNPADRSISWASAAGWAVVAGLTGGLARVVARRGAAGAWQMATGDSPPGIQTA